MLSERELKSLLSEYGIRPNKLLGQNFLVDKNMQNKILANCNLKKEDIVLEIGAGLGALTFDIAKCVQKVFAIEKDKILSKILKDLVREYDNLEIINRDILDFNIKNIFKNKKLKIIGNLPYYITSPILSFVVENRKCIDSVFFTVQKEFGARLVASPGPKDYSPISVYVQFYTDPRILFLIRKGVFYPQPEVDSVFVRFNMLNEPRVEVKDEDFFFKVVKAAFSKRRKTLLNALSQGQILSREKKDIEDLLRSIGINPMKRPEELSLQDFADIANSL